jgi:hypothetical protein
VVADCCSIGEDETWSDQGDRGIGVFSERPDVQEINAIIALRAELLSRIVPHTPIRKRCKIHKTWLEIRGDLGSYRIAFGWSAAALIADKEICWLTIPRKVLDVVVLDLSAVPIELDHRTETILRKAYVLANDWKIEDPDLVRQLGSQRA